MKVLKSFSRKPRDGRDGQGNASRIFSRIQIGKKEQPEKNQELRPLCRVAHESLEILFEETEGRPRRPGQCIKDFLENSDRKEGAARKKSGAETTLPGRA